MDACKYCEGSGSHAPGCPAVMAVAANTDKRTFKELPQWLRQRPDAADICRFCRGKGAHEEDCSLADPDRPDFRNIDLTDIVMAEGDGPLVEKLRIFVKEHGFDDERFEASLSLQKLRRQAHAAAERNLELRLRNPAAPTEEELSMGAFAEILEPQVRDAVAVMRKKGFSTASSGFGSFDLQTMVLQSPDLLDLTDDECSAMEKIGVNIDKDSRSFDFRCDRADIDDIKKRWDAIAAALPDLGRRAPDTDHGQSRSFRKKYGRP